MPRETQRIEVDVVIVNSNYLQKGNEVRLFVRNNQAGRRTVHRRELHGVKVFGVARKMNLGVANRDHVLGGQKSWIVVLHGLRNVEVVNFVVDRDENVFVPVADEAVWQVVLVVVLVFD